MQNELYCGDNLMFSAAWWRARASIFATLPTKPMQAEIDAAGKFKHPMLDWENNRLQVITVAETFGYDGKGRCRQADRAALNPRVEATMTQRQPFARASAIAALSASYPTAPFSN